MNCEIELKYSLPEAISSEAVFGILHFDTNIEIISMKSTYFDTLDNLLGKTNTSLRHRMENDSSVFTMKSALDTKGALARRGEWQVDAKTLEEALPLLLKQGAPHDAISIAQAPLKTIAEFEFVRKCAVIKTERFTAELCVDIGYLSPDGVIKAPLREIELELIDGDVSALCDFGNALSERLNLTPQPFSKLSRARNLK